MGARLTEIVIDCRDPDAQAAFWAAVLDYHVVRAGDGQVEIAPWPEEPHDLAEQVRRGPVSPSLVFATVPEGKVVKNRLHLDVRPVGEVPYEQELERLFALGATRANVGQGLQMWVVLADPEGNEFCLLGSLTAEQ